MSRVQQHSAQRWSIRTPAKLNFSLELLAKRADGYHDLEMVMVPINLYDDLVVEIHSSSPTGKLSLSLEIDNQTGLPDEIIPADDRNLVWKAAEKLLNHVGYNGSVHFRLLKRIPSQAGLGGGSSDAAATLLLLEIALGLSLADKMPGWAAELGSDVPYFLNPTPAICRGRGEILVPFSVTSGLNGIVVKPEFGLSTAEVYRRSTLGTPRNSAMELVNAWQQGRLLQQPQTFFNALQAPALVLRPELEQLLYHITATGAVVSQMTGSGSCCFGLFATEVAARQSQQQLQQDWPWVQLVQILTK